MMASKNGAVVIARVHSHQSCGQTWPDQVQFPEAAPYVGCVCCLILAIVLRGLTVGTPVKPSPQKAGVCGRAVNTTNSGGPGLKPRSSRCIFRQLILLHFVSLHPGV